MSDKLTRLAERFENPIVHMDRDGNGYCRIDEFWESMCCISFSSLEEYEAYEAAQLAAKNLQVQNMATTCKKCKKPGKWSNSDRKKLRELLAAGVTDETIAQLLGRTPMSIRRMTRRCGYKRRAQA